LELPQYFVYGRGRCQAKRDVNFWGSGIVK